MEYLVRERKTATDVVALLKICAKQKDLHKGTNVHASVLNLGLIEKNCYVASTLVNMYAKCGALAKAAQVLDELPVRDVVSWNALIAGHVQQGYDEEALKCLECMQQDGLFPNAVTFTCILRACGSIGAVDKGEQIHNEITRQGLLEKDMVLGTVLVDMYAKCGALPKAARVHQGLPVRNVVSWSALIAGYAQQGQGEEALKCFEQMQCEGLSPNAVTFTCILKACGSVGAVDKGEQIYNEIGRQGLLGKDVVLGTSVVNMYAQCGALAKAARVHDELPARNVVSWNALLTGYSQHGKDEETLKCFGRMQLEGLSPNRVTYMCILKACGSVGAADKGEEFYEEIVKRGFLRKDSMLGTAVVDMYAKFGELAKAASVLDELPVHNVVTWNALIAGYAQHGQGEEALKCFKKMQQQRVLPDTVTYIYMLKACGSIGAADKGEGIHNEIVKKGLVGNDIVLGNSLVDMYAKCGALAKAAHVSNKLSFRNVATWNALIAGFSQQEQDKEGLKCFELMLREGVSPNIITFICILKACGNIGAVDKGKQIHEEIGIQGLLEKDIILGNVLVNMYTKCGAFAKAAHVLDELPVRNVVSWNALIAGYVQQGQGEEALKCFQRMQQEGLLPNAVTFICLLKACGSIGKLDKGKQLHKHILRLGLLGEDVALGNTLVDMYAKCGALALAAKVFDKLPARDLVSWNALIAGHVQQGQGEGALECFRQMQREGFSPNTITITSILRACGSIGAAVMGQQIHDEILRWGLLEKDIGLGTALVDMYAKCGELVNAAGVFDKLLVQDVATWNALIAGYAQQGQGHEALKCFEHMRNEGFCPNTVTLTCILKACGSIGAAVKGKQLHDMALRQGWLKKDVVLGTTVVDMYVKLGALAKAALVLDELHVRNEVSWNALMTGYAQEGMGKEALNCFERMQLEGFSPNSVSFTCVLKVCGSIGAADKGEQFHKEIVRRGLLGNDIVLGTSLVDMYAKCNKLSKATQLLEQLHVRDSVFWNALIAGYAQQGQGEEALKCLKQMLQEGLSPDTVTLACVLSACSCSGLVDEGEVLFGEISTNYGITTDVEHYTCMVDLFARAGEFNKAIAVIKKLPSIDHLPVWLALLGACGECGNVNLGRLAFQNAVQVNKNDAAAYVLMTKIYAAAGMQEDANNIQAMREKGIMEGS